MIEVNRTPIVVDSSKPARTLFADFDDMFLDSFVPRRDHQERLSSLASFLLASLSFGSNVESDFDTLRNGPSSPETHFLPTSSQDSPGTPML